MSIKQFTFAGEQFPCNPKTFTVSHVRRLSEWVSPYNRDVTQEIGFAARRVEGTGLILGGQAEERAALRSCFYQEGSEVLNIGTEPEFYAYFQTLEITGDAETHGLKYRFVFVEDCNRQVGAA